MKKIALFSLMLLFMGIMIVKAQTKELTGTVTSSDDGSLIPGVSVLVKGTTLGTITNIDGEFRLKAPGDAKALVFSFIGMKNVEVEIEGQSNFNVKMSPDVFGIDEVIVAGVAGATEKKKLSVSVASVTADDISNVPATSAVGALQGKVAGVKVSTLGKPGDGSTVLLRGAANFYGSQEPLILMDGVFVSGGLSSISAEDIASLEVVKGASASSLYGSRAGNGVIVITTKRGAVGKTEVTIRSEVGWSQINKMMDVNQSHEYELADDWQDYEGQYTKYYGVTYGDNYQGVYAAGGDNAISGARVQSDDHYSDNSFGVYYDLQDQIFQKGFNTTQYASISGGNDKYRTFFSNDYYKAGGVMKESNGYSRNTIRFNVDYYLNDWLKFSASNTFVKSLDNGSISDFRTITRLSPDSNLLLENYDGQPYYYQPDPWENEITNPLYHSWNLDDVTKQRRFLGGYKLNVKFTDFLNFDAEYSFDSQNITRTINEPYETFEVNSEELGFGYSKGSLDKRSSLNMIQKAQATLNYADQFGELDVKGKLSFLAEDRHYEYFRVKGIDYLYSDIASMDNFESTSLSSSSDQTAERAQNFFAIASLIYKDRYIFDGLYRKDGSSLFGADQRWHDYYRISGAYRVTQDITIPGVQELKINAARGTSGQRPGFNWQYEMTELSGGTLSTDQIAGNSYLKPSRTTETEIGLSGQFLNKFSFDFAYSDQESVDQFMLVNLFSPANAGKNAQWQNVGDLTAKTIEASVAGRLVEKKDWSWNMSLNFTKTKSKVEKLNVAKQYVGPSDLFLLAEGVEFGAMYGYKFVHDLETMEAQLDDGDDIANYSVNSDGIVVETSTIGTVDEAATIEVDEEGTAVKQQIGNQNPDFFMGLTSNLSYKNFNFYMLWDYRHGGDIYNRNVQWNVIAGRSAIVDQAGKAESEKKTTDYYQSLYAVNDMMDFWVEDGTFLKLREISLSYTLKQAQLENLFGGFFKECKLSAIGRNVLTFTKYSGWDPEVQKYDSDTKQYYSVDYGVYPNSSAYSFSVQLKF